ncbi:7-dehydrocholesterol reductase [Galendromus occidentalis]|uniref:7-dehydrocholesterol reductase n=1 Tax=Galendromus occidentalis TaxID=34638 RepID=A0AAJ7L576_9ACAR|nr:7-dehydrocholesterol reductase [Galendromus occidentalis]
MISSIKYHACFTIFPLMTLLSSQIGVVMLRHYVVHCQDDVCLSLTDLREPSAIWDFILMSFGTLKWSWSAMLHVILFFCYAGASTVLLGGEEYNGPRTENGFVPKYYANGFRYYLLTTTMTLASLLSGQVSAWSLVVSLDYYQSAMLASGFAICVFLLIKGYLFPGESDHGATGNIIFDFYWGTELYPRIGKSIDIKQVTNCRFGMMLWQVAVLVFTFAHFEKYGFSYAMLASAVLQSVYITKFFWWEDGYMQSIDIIVDRAGYMLCWGCICFVPFFYSLPSLALLGRTPPMTATTFLTIVSFGLLWIFLNYWCDYQRQLARKTDGKCTIWFRPVKVLRAKYIDSEGQPRQSLLLASGFWSLSRHCNYVFEVLAALFWTLPVGYAVVPYAYVTFLAVLLVHRSFRDEQKCGMKYGKYWEEYRRAVKYQIVPFIW